MYFFTYFSIHSLFNHFFFSPSSNISCVVYLLTLLLFRVPYSPFPLMSPSLPCFILTLHLLLLPFLFPLLLILFVPSFSPSHSLHESLPLSLLSLLLSSPIRSLFVIFPFLLHPSPFYRHFPLPYRDSLSLYFFPYPLNSLPFPYSPSSLNPSALSPFLL